MTIENQIENQIDETFDPDARLPLGTKLKPLKPVRHNDEDSRLPLGTKREHIPAHNDEDERLPIGTKLHNLIDAKIRAHMQK
jgi:hypothetical protein